MKIAVKNSQDQLATPVGAGPLVHKVQLDSVRAIAILAVMAAHFFSLRITAEGGRGVTLFFVLSGYLITGILLQCKLYVERDGQSVLFTLRQFYARRFLRIFPLYYLVVAVLWLVNDPGAHRSFGWLITYTTDIEHVVLGYRHDWPRWTVAHFWSLAVEEQFYLIWPCVVLLVPRRRLIWVVCGVICCGPIFRLLASWLGAPLFVRAPLPFYWVDALGLGALLAVASDPSFGLTKFISPARIAALICGVLAIFLGRYIYSIHKIYCVAEASYYLGYALVSVWLVSRAADGFTGMAGRVMSFRPLLWIGMISYGVYVYHMIVMSYWKTIPGLHLAEWQNAMIVTTLTMLLSALSFYIYERPLNNLKRYFSYRAPTRPELQEVLVPA